MKELLLVSGSPRRRELLRMIDVPFVAFDADIDETRRPNEPPEDQKLSEVIAIRISDTGEISIKGRPTDIRAVRANIESGLAVDPDAAVVIAADRNADAGILVRVVDQARVAGASKVSLAALAD